MWNKREKEVAEALYDKEQAVLKALEKYYEQALEDVDLSIRILQADEQTQSKIHRIHYQETLKKQIEGALEKLHTDTYKSISEYLNDSYTDSFVGVMYDLHGQNVPVIAPIDQNAAIKAIQLDTKLSERKIHPSANGEMVTLYESLGVDVDGLKEAVRKEITRGISTGMKYDDIARNVSQVTKAPLARAKTIVRTEGHRIQQASQEDARQAAKARGADVVKQWDSTLDGETRSTHRHLDGQIREVNKPFTSGTKEAMFPGGFGDPAEDCNCRCTALTRARAALDEEELATMKERAKFFGLEEDKKQSFAEFEKTYLKAASKVDNEKADNPVPAAKQEQPKKLGAPAANEGKLAEVLNGEMSDAYNAQMQNAPESIQQLHGKYEDRIVFADAASSKHAHYSVREGGITIDVQQSMEKDGGRALYHEIGHNIDNNMHIDLTFDGKSKTGKNVESSYSYIYKKNKFGKAIASDSEAALENYRLDIVKRHETVEAEARKTFDFSATRDFLSLLGYDEDEIEEQFSEELNKHIKKAKFAAGLFEPPPSTREKLERAFAEHIKTTLPLNARGDISDMFESTFEYVDYPFGAGHGLLYWQKADFLQPTEAFAEMYSAAITSPESWEQINKYFPNAVNVFYEMVGSAL